MKKTPWYPGSVTPVRSGWYERDYRPVQATFRRAGFRCNNTYLDLWLQDEIGGFWYVDDPKGETNDAYYTDLPWRGMTEKAK